jgi:hypothetical protein
MKTFQSFNKKMLTVNWDNTNQHYNSAANSCLIYVVLDDICKQRAMYIKSSYAKYNVRWPIDETSKYVTIKMYIWN